MNFPARGSFFGALAAGIFALTPAALAQHGHGHGHHSGGGHGGGNHHSGGHSGSGHYSGGHSGGSHYSGHHHRRHHRGYGHSGFAFYGSFYPGYGSWGYYPGYGYGYGGYGAGDRSYGNGNSPIVEVQSALADLGYYRGRVDGVIGNGTRNAIRAFQRDNGLRATGRLDERLLDELGVG